MYDYFYGAQADQFSFIRIPTVLFSQEQFKNISPEAKVLYGILLKRMDLSAKNGWFDDQGRVYIICTLEEIMETLNCGNQKAVKLMDELEEKIGLIERKRQGLGKPNLIYVKNFICPVDKVDNSTPSHFLKCENHTSGDVKTTHQEMWESHGNKTNQNQTENNKTDLIHLSVNVAGMDRESDGMDGMREDPIAKRKSYERYFREHLYIDDLKQSYPYDHGRIDEILDLLVDTVCSTAKTIRCAGEDRPAEVVKSRFMKLDYGHIQYVLDCNHDNTTEVRNIKAYMLTTLYNASMTIDHYYQTKVGHDLYGYDGG